VRYWTIF